MKTQRTDSHRPSEIIPADYSHVLEYGQEVFGYSDEGGLDAEWSNMDKAEELYAADGAFVHGTRDDVSYALLRCDVCGARYKFGSLFRHVSGEIISLGHDCADSLSLAYDEVAAKAIQGQMARTRKALIERRQRFAGLLTWGRENRELLSALKLDHKITRSMRAKLISTGARWGLSAAQASLLVKLVEDAGKPQEPKVDAPEGRQVITGEVVSVKWRDSDYGGAWKMTVKVTTEDGIWLAWGTVPKALETATEELITELVADARREDQYSTKTFDVADALKGRQVTFTGTLERSDKDQSFAFFKRPSKASVTA